MGAEMRGRQKRRGKSEFNGEREKKRQHSRRRQRSEGWRIYGLIYVINKLSRIPNQQWDIRVN